MKITSKPGDLVKISLMKKEYKGILLESSGDEKGIILLKLDSGYNIGINKKDIREVKTLLKSREKETEIEIKKDREKPSIGMVVTGGTISSELDPKTGAVKWLTSPEKLFQFYPGVFEKANVAKIEVSFMKGSENLTPKDWQKIARTAAKLLNDLNIKGVIITHGTDTLHYTASALSFFLRNLTKPIVLTYSQRSTDRASSDAALNLECAAIVALSDLAEVVVVGHATTDDDYCYALRGTKTRKLHSSRRDAFKPVNAKPLAKITKETFTPLSDYKIRTKGKVRLDLKFDTKIALVKVYPGQGPEILDYYMEKKYKGIVLELFGLGHAPGEIWTKKLKEIQKKGIVVCAAAQTIYGRLDPLVYATGRELTKSGIIYLEDMLAETAFVKLGWVLGHKEWAKSKEKVKEKMLENIAGEFGDRLKE